ncbi:septum formation family protein [Corynebacterium otitidis]|uniref:septum formation family protein n=1 Tax=Corynebacterium otitidis TaxID=29321 RepID=UPI0006279825|nr:septum formation family protein [Corynebacterium otitidis]KKO83530.1 hypothetical protein AAV33_06035 [Corynebacterium otitidis]
MAISWRSATSVRTGLIGALAGVAALFTYHAVADGFGDEGGEVIDTSGAPASSIPANAFIAVDPGACLTWEVSGSGAVSDFDEVDCSEQHRFEVSHVDYNAAKDHEALAKDATRPDAAEQAEIAEELCTDATVDYLDGTFDPQGRFSVSAILPPTEFWEAGDRTVVCGLQETDGEGNAILFSGAVAGQDQARVVEPETCLFVTEKRGARPVDCAEDHHLEATELIDLHELLDEDVPSVEAQDEALKERCTDAAFDYLGGEEALYRTTLQPLWGTLPESSIEGGSHSVNCWLAAGREEGGFSTIAGGARDEGLTVDGEEPDPPERLPAPDRDEQDA